LEIVLSTSHRTYRAILYVITGIIGINVLPDSLMRKRLGLIGVKKGGRMNMQRITEVA